MQTSQLCCKLVDVGPESNDPGSGWLCTVASAENANRLINSCKRLPKHQGLPKIGWQEWHAGLDKDSAARYAWQAKAGSPIMQALEIVRESFWSN